MDRQIRAFDTDTGATLWRHTLPVDATATPMTYRYQGRQYLVINAGGHHMFNRGSGDYLYAFRTSAMKKVLLVMLLLGLSALAAWLGSEGFYQHPARTVETLAMRHADRLPLAYFGGRLYQQHCADCHQNPAMKAPTRQALGNLSREGIMVSLEFGKMQPMAAHLSKQQRGLIALYLTDSAEGRLRLGG
jgi:hypothetical protein